MADTLVKLLEEAPFTVAEIHAEMERGGDTVSLSSVQSWSTGRTFPEPDNKARLAAALRRLSEKGEKIAARVEKVERPKKLSAGKKKDRTRGRPRKRKDARRPAERGTPTKEET